PGPGGLASTGPRHRPGDLGRDRRHRRDDRTAGGDRLVAAAVHRSRCGHGPGGPRSRPLRRAAAPGRARPGPPDPAPPPPPRPPLDGPPPAALPRTARAAWAGLLTAALAVTVVPIAVRAGRADAVLERYDTLYHLSALKHIRDTGNASSLELNAVASSAHTP